MDFIQCFNISCNEIIVYRLTIFVFLVYVDDECVADIRREEVHTSYNLSCSSGAFLNGFFDFDFSVYHI